MTDGSLDFLRTNFGDVLHAEVLARLDPTSRAALRHAGKPWAAAVSASSLCVKDFVGSVSRMKVAKELGCPWTARTCAVIAECGTLEVLQWAHREGCEWDWRTVRALALKADVDGLVWALSQGCEYSSSGIEEVMRCIFQDPQLWRVHNACARGRSLNGLKKLGN